MVEYDDGAATPTIDLDLLGTVNEPGGHVFDELLQLFHTRLRPSYPNRAAGMASTVAVGLSEAPR